MYTTGEFAERVGVHPQTVQRWDREGTLVAHRTQTGRRYYTDEDVAQALGLAMLVAGPNGGVLSGIKRSAEGGFGEPAAGIGTVLRGAGTDGRRVD